MKNENGELKDKVKWFRENQKIITEDSDQQTQNQKEISDLKNQLLKSKDDKKRLSELEKKCKLLEETLGSKDKNSTALLIQAAKTEVVRDADSESKQQLINKIKQHELEL